MRRTSDIDGTTANLSGLAPMQSKTSSATSGSPARAADDSVGPFLLFTTCAQVQRWTVAVVGTTALDCCCCSLTRATGAKVPGARADPVEECRDAGSGLGAAVEPAPLQPHSPVKLVAGVDRHDKVLKPSVRTRDHHRLDIRSRGAEQWMIGYEMLPGPQIEPALSGSGRARVEAGDAAVTRVAQEESQPDRNLKRVPLVGRHRVARIGQVAIGNRAVSAAGRTRVREQQIAGAARTHQARPFEVGDVTVLGRDLGRAHFAFLDGVVRRGGRVGGRRPSRRRRRAGLALASYEPPQARASAHGECSICEYPTCEYPACEYPVCGYPISDCLISDCL